MASAAETECDERGVTLRDAARSISKPSRPFHVGAAILPLPLFGDDGGDGVAASGPVPVPPFSPRYGSTLRSEFSAVVIEHHLKWSPLCHSLPGPLPGGAPSAREGRYDFYHVDRLVDWALENGMAVKGHVLAWHVTSPPFLADRSPEGFAESVRRHIFTTMGHFRGRIGMWDVVNESLAPDGTLAKNIFLEKMGPGYIARCFEWAHEADPTAVLYYNDNKVEGCGLPGGRSAKADALYELVRDLVRGSVPVHGVGLQCHFDAAGTGLRRIPHPGSVRKQVARLGHLGLAVNLSELDVRVGKLPGGDGGRRRRVAAQCDVYRDIVAECRKEECFDGVWLWGFTDKHTWVKDFYYGGRAGMDSPLVFDEEYNRKKAYFALREGLTDGGGEEERGGGAWEQWGKDWMVPEPLESSAGGDLHLGGDSRPDWIIEQENAANSTSR